jgi:hypothetical protein
MFEALREKGFEVHCTSHAAAILSTDFAQAIDELKSCLLDVELPITEIIGSGGGEAAGTQRLRRALAAKNWSKTTFVIEKTIRVGKSDKPKPSESISHEVDHVRTFDDGNRIAMEIEWNNKDPFFDRDLENFKRLHADGAISLGVIVTRGTTLQDGVYDLVLRFAKMHGVNSFDQLRVLGLDPTRRQVGAVMKRVERKRKPLPFDEAWASHFVNDKFAASTTHWEKLMDRVSRGVGNPCPLVLIGIPAAVVTFAADALIEPLEDESEGDPV